MSDEPTVSVVIPYSDQHTPVEMVKQARASAQAQSVPVEIIVIEDTEQRGPAWARNRGIEQTETRFVAFLDADDLWKKNKLQRQLDRMRKTGAALCVEGEPMSTEKFIEEVFIGNAYSLTSSVLIDVEVVNVWFEELLGRYEDWLFVMEAASRGGVCMCPNLVEIRKHDQGLSADSKQRERLRDRYKYGELALERVPEARSYRSDFYRNYHFLLGRCLHREGRYHAAVLEFVRAIKYDLHHEPVGGLIITLVMSVWSRLSGRTTDRTKD